MCFLVFLLFLRLSPPQEIAVGVWAGRETLGNRVLAQARTWMRFFERVFVFTDEAPPGACATVKAAAEPCNVTCVELGNLAEHLEGSEWKHRWFFAQPRFLPAMAALWELNNESPWFMFGDDDTYVFRAPVERKAASLDASERLVVGKFWTAWSRVIQDIPPIRDNHPFAQGGAGVLVSTAMMKQLGPSLRNCSLSFNDPDFAGSMRFAMCAQRIVGTKEWSPNRVIVPWSDGFHSTIPDREIAAGEVKEAPATFHQLKPEMFEAVARAHTLEYAMKNGSRVLVDLSLMAFTRCRIALGHETNKFEWRFGYWISVEDVYEPMLRATKKWKANLDGDELVGFSQEYEKGVEVICQCKKHLRLGETRFVRFADAQGSKPVVQISCDNFTYKFI